MTVAVACAHRSGMHQFKNCFLAHERLAIMDPASGDQPLFNSDRTIIVTVNGEIYNYKELRQKILDKVPDKKFATNSDCEVRAWWRLGGASAARAPALTQRPAPAAAQQQQVISHLYELYGEEVAGMLDGFFAFVILDTRTNRQARAAAAPGCNSARVLCNSARRRRPCNRSLPPAHAPQLLHCP